MGTKRETRAQKAMTASGGFLRAQVRRSEKSGGWGRDGLGSLVAAGLQTFDLDFRGALVPSSQGSHRLEM